MSINKLLKTYPRTRMPLDNAYLSIFREEYRRNRNGTGLLGYVVRLLESWMHRRVAVRSPCVLLELGAGTLNHLDFESPHTTYDIVEPAGYLLDKAKLQRTRNTYYSTLEVPSIPVYDTVISVAVLEHMTDLPAEVARSALLLKDSGDFRAGIPNEGSWIWRFAWRSTTGVAFRLRTGLDYGKIMRHEHVNKASEIIAISKYFFSCVEVKYFPLPWPKFALYAYVEAKIPKRHIAAEWLAKQP